MRADEVAERNARIARLTAARMADSSTKRRLALSACEYLLGAGLRVTFARVAREAGVSGWLVYNAPEIRSAVQAAIEKQRHEGIAPDVALPIREHPSNSSLRTDLALAREEIKSLRNETKKLRQRLELKLGAEAEGASAAEIIEQMQQLEDTNRELGTRLSESDGRVFKLAAENRELEAQVEGMTEAMRQLMWTKNTT